MNHKTHIYASSSRFLWFLTLSYTMMIVLSNWFGARLIHVFGVDMGSGTFVFPLTFLLSNLITEVYGYKNARRTIWCGFLFNLLFLFYGQIVTHLPSPPYYVEQNKMFDTIFAFNTRITIASYISYLIAEPINTYIMAKLKLKTQGKYLGFRFIVSTMGAAGVDSVLFTSLAFYGTFTNHNLIVFIITMWITKVIVETLGLPISIWLTHKLKTLEQLDIYDRNTDFTLLSLDAQYEPKNNAFERL